MENFFYQLNRYDIPGKIARAIEAYIEKCRAETRMLEKQLELKEKLEEQEE